MKNSEGRKKKVIIAVILILMLIFVLLKSCSNVKEFKGVITFSGPKNIELNYGNTFDPNSIKIFVDGEEITVAPVIDLSNVDYFKLGTYTVIVKYIDMDGTILYEEERYIEVKDMSSPEILLKGSKNLKIPLYSDYDDAGYTVTDNVDNIEDIKVVMSGEVDTNKIGTYIITYTATDTFGNTSKISRTVEVERSNFDDIESNSPLPLVKPAPIGVTTLQLKGTSTVYVEYPNIYKEPGYTAIDTVDGDITNKVIVEMIRPTTLGSYEIIYKVTNTSGKTTIVKRPVIVRDTSSPVIVLNGSSPISHEAKTVYTDLGAVATDNYNGTLSVSVNSTVNPNIKGTYNVTYTAKDSNNNSAQIIRTVIVKDTILPVIDVTDKTVDVEWYSSIVNVDAFVRDSVVASDNYDGDITSDIEYDIAPAFDIMTKGTYVVTYTVKDNSDNGAISKTKVINVQETVAPIGVASYSKTAPTNQDVTVTITTDKPINTPIGWTKVDDKVFTKIYTSNTAEIITIGSGSGVDSTVNVSIGNIDKTSINATVTYSIIMPTQLDVLAEIVTNKLVNTPDGWSKIDDTHYQKTYTSNTVVPVVVSLSDVYGNTSNVSVNVTNIDRIAPVIAIAEDYDVIEIFNDKVISSISTFMMEGVTGSDNYDGTITDNIGYSVSPAFDVTKVGTYVVTYTLKDTANNNAVSVTKTITVNEAETVTMTGYDAWPEGFVKGARSFAGGVEVGNYIWMIPANADRVVKINKLTGEMTGYNGWPAGLTKGEESFRNAVYDGEYIWMIPYYANRLIRLDPTNGEMISFGNWPVGFTKQVLAFHGGVDDGIYLWLVPHNATHLIRVNKETGVMDKYDSWPSGFTKANNAFHNGVDDGDYIWLLPYSANRLIKVNKATGDMTGYGSWPSAAAKGDFGFSEGAIIGDNIWLFPYNAKAFVSVNKNTGVMTAYDTWPSGYSGSSNRFMGGTYNGDSIWVAPFAANQVVRVNPVTGKMKGYNNWPEGFTIVNQAFSAAVASGTEDIWLIPSYADRVIKVNVKKNY